MSGIGTVAVSGPDGGRFDQRRDGGARRRHSGRVRALWVQRGKGSAFAGLRCDDRNPRRSPRPLMARAAAARVLKRVGRLVALVEYAEAGALVHAPGCRMVPLIGVQPYAIG